MVNGRPTVNIIKFKEPRSQGRVIIYDTLLILSLYYISFCSHFPTYDLGDEVLYLSICFGSPGARTKYSFFLSRQDSTYVDGRGDDLRSTGFLSLLYDA